MIILGWTVTKEPAPKPTALVEQVKKISIDPGSAAFVTLYKRKKPLNGYLWPYFYHSCTAAFSDKGGIGPVSSVMALKVGETYMVPDDYFVLVSPEPTPDGAP